MIELVQFENTRNNLKEAEKMLTEGKIEDSLDRVALAFAQLIDDYEHRKRDQFGRSPFFFGESMTFLSSFFMHVDRGKMAEFVDKVAESVEALRNAVKILSLGIDYRKYVKFRLLTPRISRVISGDYRITRIEWGSRGIPTAEDIEFCINFVIESAITLQEFDFSIDAKPNMRKLKDLV